VIEPLIHGRGTGDALWRAWGGWREMVPTTAAELVPAGARAVVVAPHPDDEVLACAGLLQELAALGRDIVVVAATDGTASHPGSRRWPAWRLQAERPRESRAAFAALGLANARWVRAQLPDGGLRAAVPRLAGLLERVIRRTDVVIATWRRDGHPDHEAAGDAAAQAALAVGARLIEAPVWAWHWAAPDDARLPWLRARRLALAPGVAQRKSRALRAFHSQIEPDITTGRAPVLPTTALQRAAWPHEVFFV
jgi:LmbE family N-acetylglucosaminyl deacetylase